MAESGIACKKTEQGILYAPETIEAYLQSVQESGVAPSAITKYSDALNNLSLWLGTDLRLDALRLQAWRQHLETFGYSKHTVQRYITRVNNYLHFYGRDDLHIPKPIRNDLTEKTFGYLTALEPTQQRQHKYVVWRCVCKCGKEVEIPSGMLLGGHTTSCGCLNTEILAHHNRYEEGTELRQSMEEKIRNPNSQSGYVGVSPKRGKWVAHITYKKQHYYLGTFSKLEDAIKARAKAKEAVMEDAARIYEETDHLYGDSPRRPSKPEKEPVVVYEPVVVRGRKSNNTSGCPGVTKQHGKWNASISVKKFRYKLGAFEKLEDAIAARKLAEELVSVGDLDGLNAICTNWNKEQSPSVGG